MKGLNEYRLSTEEFALALALVNRPELGKATMFATFGELEESVLEERLKAASHSMLARGMASVKPSGIAAIDNKLQSALAPLLLFEGMLQVTINTGEPKIINVHLRKKQFTAHWVEQGVVHCLVSGAINALDSWIIGKLDPPKDLSGNLVPQLQEAHWRLPMEAFTNLPKMDEAEGQEFLTNQGISERVARKLWLDAHRPELRAVVTYVPFNSETDFSKPKNVLQSVPGFFFLKGQEAWLLVFPKEMGHQEARLLPGVRSVMGPLLVELRQRKDRAFS